MNHGIITYLLALLVSANDLRRLFLLLLLLFAAAAAAAICVGDITLLMETV